MRRAARSRSLAEGARGRPTAGPQGGGLPEGFPPWCPPAIAFMLTPRPIGDHGIKTGCRSLSYPLCLDTWPIGPVSLAAIAGGGPVISGGGEWRGSGAACRRVFRIEFGGQIESEGIPCRKQG